LIAVWAKISGAVPSHPSISVHSHRVSTVRIAAASSLISGLKGYYGNIQEKQFRRIYAQATSMKGDASENLIGLLERRLDAVVYRAKFVPTVFAARQFVNHGHVLVNGKRVNVPSYRCKEGDVIEVREKSRTMALVLEALESPERDLPEYISVDPKAMKATFVRTPSFDEVPYPVTMEPNLVVEFYSR